MGKRIKNSLLPYRRSGGTSLPYFKNGKSRRNDLSTCNKKIFCLIRGSSFGVGPTCNCACNSAYSAAVKGLPLIGDRASVMISVRNISSGVSSGGGNAITDTPRDLLNPTSMPVITVNTKNKITFFAFRVPISRFEILDLRSWIRIPLSSWQLLQLSRTVKGALPLLLLLVFSPFAYLKTDTDAKLVSSLTKRMCKQKVRFLRVINLFITKRASHALQ